MVEASCPVCEAGLIPGAPACGTCGFPVSLREEASRAIRESGGTPAATAPGGPRHADPVARRTGRGRSGPDPVEPLAVELAQTLAHLKKEGADVAEFVEELKRAAFEQIEGRPTEAVAVLRKATKKVESEAKRRTEARVATIEARRSALAQEGIQDGQTPSWDRARRSLAAGEFDAADELLTKVDRETQRIDGELHELRASLTSLEELAQVGTEANVPRTDVDRLEKLRSFRGTKPQTAEALAEAKRAAAELSESLRKEIARHLSEELSENAEALSEFPVHHPPAQRLRRLHAEAAVRLRDGQLSEASRLVAELRRATAALPPYQEPEAPPPPPARRRAEPAPPAPKEELTVDAVVAIARSLASRVRSLPPGSPLANRATPEIRRATELLKHRKLEEAHEVLTRLMDSLDAAAADIVEGERR